MNPLKNKYRPTATVIILFLSIFLFHHSASFSGTFSPIRGSLNYLILCKTCQVMLPMAPITAEFNDPALEPAVKYDLAPLAPQAPSEADFSNETDYPTLYKSTSQAAGLPVETDNNYSVNDLFWDLSFLAPVAPGEASFE